MVKVGESLVIFNEDDQPNGAIVIGLGEQESLTSSELRRSVKCGILEYLLYVKEQNELGKMEQCNRKIASMFIGSGFGNLSLISCITAILKGVSDANKEMYQIKNGKYNIDHIEFVDYYQDKANLGLKTLYSFTSNKGYNHVELNEDLIVGKGGIKRSLYVEKSANWWPTFTTRVQKNGGQTNYLRFFASGMKARVRDESSYASFENIERIVGKMSTLTNYDNENSKMLFDLTIPPALKDIIQSQNNIQWKLDRKSAEIPWELLNDSLLEEEPTFVNAGLIRQFIERDASDYAELSRSKKALVVGDPKYNNDLPDLQGALEEAKEVAKLLDNDYHVTALVEKNTSLEILKELLIGEHEIIHIAGHGIYDEEKKMYGIAVEDSIITAGDIGQLAVIPKLVFINCCHLGKVDSSMENYYNSRHKLAANIGSQLIKMGVPAVIAAGWAVEDGAAKIFARTVYHRLLDGYFLGEAIREARNVTYRYNVNVNTWGAYQVYGSPHFQLRNYSETKNPQRNYCSVEEILIDLHNIKIQANSAEKARKEVEEIQSTTHFKKFQNQAKILESLGNTFAHFNMVSEALSYYGQLFNIEDADFSFRTVEEYCRFLVLQFRKKGERNEKHERFIADRAETVLKAGKTYKRYMMVADVYRSLQSVHPSLQKKYVDKMMEYYQEAYRVSRNMDTILRVKSLSNWMVIHFLKNRKSTKLKFDNGSPILVKDKVDVLMEQLRNSGISNQCYEFHKAMLQLEIVRLIYSNLSELDIYKTRIERRKAKLTGIANPADMERAVIWLDLIIKILMEKGDTRGLENILVI